MRSCGRAEARNKRKEDAIKKRNEKKKKSRGPRIWRLVRRGDEPDLEIDEGETWWRERIRNWRQS